MDFVETTEECDLILVGLPVNKGTEKEGCDEAPSKIREYFDNFFFSESVNNNRILDKGDITEENNFDTTMSKIYEKMIEYFKFNKPIITLGGNHSITFPIIRALSRFYEKIGVIHIDAHPDCQIDYMPYGDVIGSIKQIDEVKKIIMLGLRNWSKYEYNYLKEEKIPFIDMNSFIEAGIDYCLKKIKDYVSDCDAIYVTFDIDAIDPAYAPGTGWKEPGGITSRDAIKIVQSLAKLPTIKGFDLVEVNPSLDQNDITSILAAKIVFEFADNLGTK